MAAVVIAFLLWLAATGKMQAWMDLLKSTPDATAAPMTPVQGAETYSIYGVGK